MTALLRRPEAISLGSLILALAAGAALSPYFLDPTFLLDSAVLQVEIGLVALVLAAIVISGEIDLSVASMIALSGCVFGLSIEAGSSLPLAIAVALSVGAAMGLLNGFLIAVLGLPSLISTIGTLTLYRGLAQAILGDRSITDFPDGWIGIDGARLGGVPVPVILLTVAALGAGVLLHRTAWGRHIFLVGANENAARYAGVRVKALKVGLLTLMGLVSAAAGLMMSSRLGVVRYDMAMGGELQAVLIVVLGGVTVAGGRGSLAGVFIAFWSLVLVQAAMTVANVPIEQQLTVLGLLLLAVVALTGRRWGRKD